MKKLYFGDNLQIMREMEDGHIDLICTDPPFNSGRDYNAFIRDSLAQKKAFTDTWNWDTPAEKQRTDIEKHARTSDTYKALDNCLRGYDLVLQNAVDGNKGAMRAYLTFMGPRLVEMHRLLKDTGSIYLHCDPTASHYLKGVMDAIFDDRQFRNEVVWCYKSTSQAKRWYPKKHDTLLFYTKGVRWIFNADAIRIPFSNEALGRHGSTWKSADKEEREQIHAKGKVVEDWWEIPMLNSMAKERLGYPTQKPRALYERMIKASSDAGMRVMDPFCGCGTTIDAAHTLGRYWIGIDLTILALDPMKQRLQERHGLRYSVDYDIEGYPTNMQEVRKLVRDAKKYHDFSNWAVTRLGLEPTPDAADGGKDGIGHITLWNPQTSEEKDTRILAEVKSGKPTIEQVKAFCHTMNEHDALGIFITIEPVTAGMRQVAANMGTFEHNNQRYPRLQFWQIDDAYFENPNRIDEIIQLPRKWIHAIRKSERHFENTQMTLLDTND